MPKKRSLSKNFLIIALTVFLMPLAARSDAEEFRPSHAFFKKNKALWDDPRPFFKVNPIKSEMPPEEYAKLVRADIDTVKQKWVEVVGFKSPDLVGKIASQIKPGKYTFADKEKYPGFKELMIPLEYELMWREPGPPNGFAFMEFEVVPTTQCYMRLNLAEATLEHEGKSKLNAQGYLVDDSYVTGLPFPKPSGQFKAQQIMYNWVKRAYNWDQTMQVARNFMGDKNLNKASATTYTYIFFKFASRVDNEPFGVLDKRAIKGEQLRSLSVIYHTPRDQSGNVIWSLETAGTEKNNQIVMWVNELRRLRRLSGTDTQDTYPGSNYIFDDAEFFIQKLHPEIFPYEFKLIEEREFLVPFVTWDGSEYVAKENMERKNVKMQRRPMYVVELKQKDSTYVYGRRLFYIDKETHLIYMVQNFDQEGRLWRFTTGLLGYPQPEIPLTGYLYLYNLDVIDPQSEFEMIHWLPAPFLTRTDVNISSLKKWGK